MHVRVFRVFQMSSNVASTKNIALHTDGLRTVKSAFIYFMSLSNILYTDSYAPLTLLPWLSYLIHLWHSSQYAGKALLWPLVTFTFLLIFL